MTLSEATPCPLCGLGTYSSRDVDTHNLRLDCRRCGRFAVTVDCLDDLRAPDATDRLPFLSAATRQAWESGDQLTLLTTNWQEYALRYSRTTMAGKIEKLLHYLGKKCLHPGRQMQIGRAHV